MILTHFTPQPFKLNIAMDYGRVHWGKPTGLWLSDESDHGWKKWCEGNDWSLDDLKYATQFECDLGDWIVLRTDPEIRAFTKKYLLEWPGPGSVPVAIRSAHKSVPVAMRSAYIDWPQVKRDYSGILITPYSWKLRLDFKTHWYYGWDCASGCVWDLTTIKQVGALDDFRPHVPMQLD